MKILKALAVFILSISTTNAATLKVGVTAGPHGKSKGLGKGRRN
jgi:hypothetical protein